MEIKSTMLASILLASSFSVSSNTQINSDKDSVESWGVWAQNYITAGGGEFNSRALLQSDISIVESGRTSLNESLYKNASLNESVKLSHDVPTYTCEMGSFCTYGKFDLDSKDGQYLDDPGEAVGILKVTDIKGAAALQEVFDSRVLDPEKQDGVSLVFGIDSHEGVMEGLAEVGFVSYRQSSNDVFTTSYGVSEVQGKVVFYFIDELSPLIAVGWDRDNADTGFERNGTSRGGIVTSLEQLNTFVSNMHGPIATYSGQSFDTANFEIDINFGSNTWSGSFEETSQGNDAFQVSGGTLLGASFTAKGSQLSATDGAVEGAVSGAIFGDNAEAVAGIIDIKKAVGEQIHVRKNGFNGYR